MQSSRMLKPITFVVALLPFIYMLQLAIGGHLGPDPGKKLALLTGEWSIRLLLLTLSISPLARLNIRLKLFLQCRRMVGLFAFFYASIHLLVFLILFLDFDGQLLFSEIKKRPYITVGIMSWLLMLPMALTSNRMALKWLGGSRWKHLHQAIYISVLLVVVHVVWQVRSDWSNALLYAVITLILLTERRWSNQSIIRL